ncbi:MAG: hypothetical protein HYV94_05580 [Candidatus Rokubacteria bacterium]|nr:hypothetical protein [Candidatus Rokubacteria bacterium]MBI2491555.1 hypothetical protein [Candidatus Rokubacteria bacterium]
MTRAAISALLALLLAGAAAGEAPSPPVSGRAAVEPAGLELPKEALRPKLEADLAEQQKRLRLLAVLETVAIVGCLGGIAARMSSMWVRACGAALPLGAIMIQLYLETREIARRLHGLEG